MKDIIFSNHSLQQCTERGATMEEVIQTIKHGERLKAKGERWSYKMNFQFNNVWNKKHYAIKQICAIIKEGNQIIVITVYTFYF